MAYYVNVVANCEDSHWDSDTEKFPASVKKLIDGLGVDYKFKIITAGAQKSSYDSDDLLTISRKYTSGIKLSFSVDSLSTAQSFQTSLAEECAKITSNYELNVRARRKPAE